MARRAAGGCLTILVLCAAGLGAVLQHSSRHPPPSFSPGREAGDTPRHHAADFAKGQEFHGEVVHVADGDTLDVLRDGQAVRIRLFGVDCPESHQAFGQTAKQFTSEFAFRQDARVVVHDQDRYGRTVGEVFVTREGKERNLNEALVVAGLAWAYRHYSTAFVPQEEDARASGRGLWAVPGPVPPWEFRRQPHGTEKPPAPPEDGL